MKETLLCTKSDEHPLPLNDSKNTHSALLIPLMNEIHIRMKRADRLELEGGIMTGKSGRERTLRNQKKGVL